MSMLNMNGPYPLTANGVDRAVTYPAGGNFALGHTEKGTYVVEYIGRADTDLPACLKGWEGKYSQFKYTYATSAAAAYDRECRNYHEFGGSRYLDNKAHPRPPAGAARTCPICTASA